ncbi:LysM peptidoglycan-binding domain-containing protein [Psychroflexus sp. ALD_RP9]|uniref:LysM peptidoglycan-binding domain-containing protein n=1 Tax=Psychroflexus sp. ALD_RP9 TaxID=2777186 RepID=UPI001A8DEA8E|nr:LysM peptidoglycan-binding domain-containing protein [Psychroflexus sp. ALD_RP9]QSS97878.1 LysM peptidoglycan-binding domain-containing protein [Psychroflexus sp. ALD_RP9]
MKYLLFVTITILSVNIGFSQNSSAHKDKAQTLSVQQFNEIVQDSLRYVFYDYVKTIKLDKRWQKALSDTQLFDKLHSSITDSLINRKAVKQVPTETLKQRLADLNEKTPFKIEYNESLESVINYYLQREQKSTERLISLSYFYFPMFEEIFAKYNIPLEMKYLALVESALNPRAKSPVGATGLWQFMYPTGKMFDLNVSSYVDERMDPLASTEAAAKYLNRLYSIFNDWDLALAAYNSGPGNVSKAIRRSGGKTNYWELRRFLPRETAGYVPSFQAMMYLFEYAEEHQLVVEKPQQLYYATDTIRVKQLVKLEHIAEVTQVDRDYLKFLNPSYKLGIVPFEKNKDYYIRLPYQAAGIYAANEDKIYNFAKQSIALDAKPLPKNNKAEDRIKYRVKSGDYLGKIANKFGVRISQIKRWNNLRSNRLKIGQRLWVYPKSPDYVETSTKTKSSKPKLNSSNSNSDVIYTVKSGDSLWSIANKFPEVSIEDLKSINKLSSSKLQPGMQLKLQKS